MGNNAYLGPWYEAVANWFREQYLENNREPSQEPSAETPEDIQKEISQETPT
jgi:hypothetical protein